MPRCPPEILYSDKYKDENYEYRHVILPQDLYKRISKLGRLLTELEWRNLGVKGTVGWEHYEYYKPEPHILLLRKPIQQ